MDELDSIIRQINEEFGEGTITTASELPRPERALEKQAIDDFMDRNPMAGGGMLVQPSADGRRPGYSKDKTKTLKKMDIAGRSATGETIDLKKVQELVTKANQGNKYLTAEDIAAQYYKNKKIGKEYIREYEGKKTKKFPRLWGSPAVNEILKTLDPKELKVQKVLEDMLADENPFTTGKLKNTNKKLSDLQFSKMAPWKQYISNETGLAYKGIESSLNSKNFMDGWYKNNRATLISFGQIKKDLEGLSFSQQLNYATDVRGNKPVYTRIEKTRSSVFDVMDYALRSWNNTKGKGPIQFFDKNGKPIKWQTNKKLPYSQVSFKYDGNTYSVGGSNNTISLRKSGNTFFPEVYEQNSFKNKLYDTLVDNPFKPGKEIQFGKLMNLIQNKGYGWKKGTGVLDILHGPNGVALEPFTNLSFGTRDLNLTLSQIDKIPIKGLKNKYINILTKDFKGKSGEELIQAIINQQTNLASKIATGEKFIIPTRTQLFLDTLDPDKRIIGDVGKNTEKYIKQKIYEQTRPSSKLKPNVVLEIENTLASFGDGTCAVQFGPRKRDGGRIGYQVGTIDKKRCIESGINNFKDGKFKTADQAQDAAKLLGGGQKVLRGLMKYGIVPEAAYVAGEAVFRNILGEKPLNALKKSVDTFTFGMTDFTSGIEAEKFGKDADRKLAVDKFRASQNKVNSIEQEIANLETLNTGSQFGYEGDQTEAIQMKKAQLEAAKKELEQNYVNPDIVQYIDRKAENIADAQMAKSGFAKASAKDQMDGIPGVTDYMDTETARVFPKQPSQTELNLNMFPSFQDYQKSDQGQIDRTILNAPDKVLQEISPDALDLKKALQEEYKMENLKNTFGAEQIYGTQGVFSQPLAGGGIAKLAGVDQGPPPESGPNPQGLQGLLNRVKKI